MLSRARYQNPPKSEGFLRAWAKEDVYFPLDCEVEWLKQAGFSVEVSWRRDCFAVLAGFKKTG